MISNRDKIPIALTKPCVGTYKDIAQKDSCLPVCEVTKLTRRTLSMES